MYSYLHSKLGGNSDSSTIFSGFKLDNTSKALLSNLNLNTKKIQTKEVKLMNGVAVDDKDITEELENDRKNTNSYIMLDSEELFMKMKPNFDRYVNSIIFGKKETVNKNKDVIKLSNVNRFHFDIKVESPGAALTLYPLGDNLSDYFIISEYPFEFKYKAKITLNDLIRELTFDKNSDFPDINDLDPDSGDIKKEMDTPRSSLINIDGYIYGSLDKTNLGITMHYFSILSPDLNKYNLGKYMDGEEPYEYQCSKKFECIKTLKELQIEGCFDVRK